MPVTTVRETAKIYQFPKTPRPVAASRQDLSAIDFSIPNYSDAAYGNSWYHEAALVEVEPTRRS